MSEDQVKHGGYFAVIFIPQGHLGIYHFNLRTQIYNMCNMEMNEMPTHCTLKYHFQCTGKQLLEIEEYMKEFAQKTAYSSLIVEGFDHFGNDTIYMTVKPSKEMWDSYLEFINKMEEKFPFLQWRKHPISGELIEREKLILHCTLVEKIPNVETFEKIWNYLKENEMPKNKKFIVPFNGISLVYVHDGFLEVKRFFYFEPPTPVSLSKFQNQFDQSFISTITLNKTPDLMDVTEKYKGEIQDILLLLKLGEKDMKNLRLWKSDKVCNIVDVATRRHVTGLSTKSTIRFIDVMNIIIQKKYRVFMFGGFLRDLFGKNHISDDIDVLFTCTTELLAKVSDVHGWSFYFKKDEKTEKIREDFIAMGKSKTKFSGHVLGTGCEGDFVMNTLLFDVKNEVIIDPYGRGIEDSSNFILSIPNEAEFEEWVSSDRLLGMKLLRFFNFRSRNFGSSIELKKKIVLKTKELLDGQSMKPSIKAFVNRKLFGSNRDKNLVAESKFRNSFVKDFDEILGNGAGDKYYQHHIMSLFPPLQQ